MADPVTARDEGHYYDRSYTARRKAHASAGDVVVVLRSGREQQ